jgi:hypothetical protein
VTLEHDTMDEAAQPRAWRSAGGLVAVVLAVLCMGGRAAPARPYATWQDYGGSPDSMQYSSLRQIDASNVGQLRAAGSRSVP